MKQITPKTGHPTPIDAENIAGTPENDAIIALAQGQDLKRVREHCPQQIGAFQACYSGKSRKAAIKAMCINCEGFQPHFVKDCQIYGCPLWLYRAGHRKAVRHA